jgi:DNA-binding MarR family transcriptional regulator
MTARDEPAVEDSLDAITDALLTASRLLVVISARSIARVDETITIPQFRTLVILSARGPISVRTLAGLLYVQRSTTGQSTRRQRVHRQDPRQQDLGQT